MKKKKKEKNNKQTKQKELSTNLSLPLAAIRKYN